MYVHMYVYVESLGEMMVTFTIKMVKMPKSYPFPKSPASKSLANKDPFISATGRRESLRGRRLAGSKQAGTGPFGKEQINRQRGAWEEEMVYK